MTRVQDRKDELLALALAARRRDSRDSGRTTEGRGSEVVPTPAEDELTDVVKGMSPDERALYRKFLEDLSQLKQR